MKRWFCLGLLIILLTSVTSLCFAHDKRGHNQDLEEVLFGKGFDSKALSDQAKQTVDAIEAASYLAIDQYNGNGADELKLLKDQNILGLPDDISEIDFTANSQHRSFTHRGWDYFYTNDRAHWNTRKSILLNTINEKFDFGEKSNQIVGFNKKCNSFSAVIYYIHIIGDHIEDKSYKYSDLKIAVGGTNDDQNIIKELLKHSEILFSNPRTMIQRIRFTQRLKSLDGKFKKIVLSEGGVNSNEKYNKYHMYCEELLQILKEEMPYLLKKEEFFSKVFYPQE